MGGGVTFDCLPAKKNIGCSWDTVQLHARREAYPICRVVIPCTNSGRPQMIGPQYDTKERRGMFVRMLVGTNALSYLLVLLVGAVKTVHAHSADLDALPKCLANLAPDTAKHTEQHHDPRNAYKRLPVPITSPCAGIVIKTAYPYILRESLGKMRTFCQCCDQTHWMAVE